MRRKPSLRENVRESSVKEATGGRVALRFKGMKVGDVFLFCRGEQRNERGRS